MNGSEVVVSRLVNVVKFTVDKLSGENAKKWARQVGKSVMAVTAAITAATVSLAKLAIDSNAALRDSISLAGQLGISADEILHYEFALQAIGASTGDLASSFGSLQGKLKDVAGGNTKTEQMFKRLGVRVRDANGDVRAASELFPDLARGIGLLGTAAERERATLEVFGESGAKLNGFFKEGGKGLDDLRLRSRRLGRQITEQDIKALEAFDDTWLDLRTTMLKWGDDLRRVITPHLTTLMGQFAEFMRSDAVRGGLEKAIRGIGAAFEFLTTDAGKAVAAVGLSVGALGALATFLKVSGLAGLLRGVAAAASTAWTALGGPPAWAAGFAIAAIAGHIAAFYGIWKQIENTAAGKDTWVRRLADQFGLGAELAHLWNVELRMLGETFTYLKGMASDLWEMMRPIWNASQEIYKAQGQIIAGPMRRFADSEENFGDRLAASNYARELIRDRNLSASRRAVAPSSGRTNITNTETNNRTVNMAPGSVVVHTPTLSEPDWKKLTEALIAGAAGG